GRRSASSRACSPGRPSSSAARRPWAARGRARIVGAERGGATGDDRVLVLAPTGRDASVLAAALEENDFAAVPCEDLAELYRAIGEGAGAAVIAEEALPPREAEALGAALSAREPWSDLPIVILAGEEAEQVDGLRHLERGMNATILRRPLDRVVLVTALRAAL